MSGDDQRAFAQWLRDRADAVVNDDPAAAATLYLAAEQAPAGIVAPAWGPFPTAAEVTAHVAAHPPLRWSSPWATGAPWLRLSGNGDLSVIYLAIVDGVVRARFGGLPEWHELEFGRAGMWRSITVQGEATDERDATIAILEAHAAHDATAIAQNVADLRDTRAQVAALTAERDAAFNRGVEAMREAAAKVAAECASERGHTQAAMFAAGRPDDAFVVGIKGGEASRIEGLIRALKVAP